MNLLNEPWLPVHRRDGSREWVAVDRLSDPEIVAFDASRPDFNGALAQFAIGLLQTTTPMDSPPSWKKWFENPPDAATLGTWFAPVAAAFKFDGDGARFMQDFDLKPNEGAVNEIGALLIESPGENASKNNTDHFVKRGRVSAMCPRCAALALLTLQINAPSGGAGHRTGLRGGGPLTTLIVCQPRRSLWHDLWFNVRERSHFLAQGGDATLAAPVFTFPWLAGNTAIQKDGGETAPMQTHPAQVFWAMPRRIHLDFDAVSVGDCGICGEASDRLVRQYITKNYGLNYKGAWDHPLSPYYETKEGWLPLHPQPGGLGYRHWLAWVLGMITEKKKQRRARVVDHVLAIQPRKIRDQLALWAFGYDMDNMKARCWYESTLPLFGLADCEPAAQRRIESEVGLWLAGAEMAAFYLRSAVKDAWFSGDARGDFSFIDASFWGHTESAFYAQLKTQIDIVRESRELNTVAVSEAWQHVLINAVIALFDDEFVGAGQVAQQNPQRIAKAYRQLRRNLAGTKMRQTLGLPPLESNKPKANTKAAPAAKEGT